MWRLLALWGICCLLISLLLGIARQSPPTSTAYLYYTSNQDRPISLYRRVIGSQHAENLTAKLGIERNYVLSPDGTRIAFQAFEGSAINLKIIPADASSADAAQQVTQNIYSDELGGWSPDGQALVYGSFRAEEYSLYITDVQSGQERRLTFDSGDERFPLWSPDGKWIAYLSSVLATPALPSARLISADGTTAITPEGITRLEVYGMGWSADGRYLVLHGVNRSTRTIDALITSVEDATWQTVPVSESVREVRWLPDGHRLGIVLTAPSGASLHIFDPDAGTLTHHTDLPDQTFLQHWLPAGAIFLSTLDGTDDLLLLDDAGNWHPLAAHPAYQERSPQGSPALSVPWSGWLSGLAAGFLMMIGMGGYAIQRR